jgi:hypothetical protein
MVWRPEETKNTNSGVASWLGGQKVAIKGFLDKSADFDWADVFLEIELDVEGQEYDNTLKLLGSFEKDADGNLIHNGLVKKIYDLADVIGFKGGIDIKGNWVDEEDKPIDSIDAYLSAKFAQGDGAKPTHWVYVYNQQAKAGSAKDFYQAVYPKMWPLTADGKKQMDSFVVFMRKGNKWKEYTETQNNYPEVQTALGGQSAGAMSL